MIKLIIFLVGALVVMGLVIVTLMYRNRADRKSQELATQQTINTAVAKKDQHREDLDKRLHALREAQRHETIEGNAHLADRSDFDNDWGGLPRSGACDGAADSAAESPIASGAAGDNGERDDMLGR